MGHLMQALGPLQAQQLMTACNAEREVSAAPPPLCFETVSLTLSSFWLDSELQGPPVSDTHPTPWGS